MSLLSDISYKIFTVDEIIYRIYICHNSKSEKTRKFIVKCYFRIAQSNNSYNNNVLSHESKCH